jgi:hypothetical protein
MKQGQLRERDVAGQDNAGQYLCSWCAVMRQISLQIQVGDMSALAAKSGQVKTDSRVPGCEALRTPVRIVFHGKHNQALGQSCLTVMPQLLCLAPHPQLSTCLLRHSLTHTIKR